MDPMSFIQAANGALVAILAWMLMFSWLYLVNQWRSFERKVSNVYYVSKMAVAMTTFLFGFFVDRVSAAIWLKHMTHPAHYNLSIASIPMLMLLAGALVAIVGGACWIRVLAPERGPLCSWPVVMVSSLLFGWLVAAV